MTSMTVCPTSCPPGELSCSTWNGPVIASSLGWRRNSVATPVVWLYSYSAARLSDWWLEPAFTAHSLLVWNFLCDLCFTIFCGFPVLSDFPLWQCCIAPLLYCIAALPTFQIFLATKWACLDRLWRSMEVYLDLGQCLGADGRAILAELHSFVSRFFHHEPCAQDT